MAANAANITVGATSTDTLSRDVFLEVKEAFNRANILMNLIQVQTITSGHAGRFVIGGKDTSALAKTQGRGVGVDTEVGNDISVNPVNLDQRLIPIDNLVYDARRIDDKEEKLLDFGVRQPITNMIGTVLGNKMDELIAYNLGLAAEGTGLADNPDAPAVIVNSAIASGSTAKDKGNALGESIMMAVAQLKKVDNYNEKYVVVDPVNAAYLAQSDFINKDYTSGSNGGLDTGVIGMVGGAKVYECNSLDAITNIEDFEALVFTREAVGLVKLQDVTTETNYDFNKFATLVSGRYAIGCGILRPECCVAIASGVQS